MILLLTLKPAAVWAAEDQKQEETEVPEESRTQEDRELNQVAAEVSAPACAFDGSFHGNGTDGKGSG